MTPADASPGTPAVRRGGLPLIPTLMTLPAVLLMLGLGTWQLERLAWKTALIADRVERTTAPPIPLPSTIGDDEYRQVRVAGEFLHEKEMHLVAHSQRGNVGFQVITPLRLEGGGHLLVSRGWVPQDRRDPVRRAAGQVAGRVELEAVLRAAGRHGWLTPDNNPERNVWFTIDVPAMARYAGLDPAAVRPFYVDAGPAPNPGGYPLGGQTRVNLPNDHLQYAITWYSLGIAFMVIYLVYVRRQRRDEARTGSSEVRSA
jgi:surfeit locus 1 family protein